MPKRPLYVTPVPTPDEDLDIFTVVSEHIETYRIRSYFHDYDPAKYALAIATVEDSNELWLLPVNTVLGLRSYDERELLRYLKDTGCAYDNVKIIMCDAVHNIHPTDIQAW